MKKITFIIPLLFLFTYCGAVNEVEPNNDIADSGVITVTTNEIITGEATGLPTPDYDYWNIEAGTSGDVTFTKNHEDIYLYIHYGNNGYVNSGFRSGDIHIVFDNSFTLNLNPSYYYTVRVLCLPVPQSINYSVTLSGGALPVEMTSFNAALTSKNQTDLNWQTASELNNHYFQIEHSTDARSFTPIGVVDGKGTTNESQDYYYRHLAPRFGQNYYRLKQVDFDGTFAYSDLVNVNYKIKGDIHPILIYPNPVSDQLSLTNISSGELSLEVFNVLGEFQFKGKLTEGQHKEFPTDQLIDGPYFIRIKTENEYLNQKFIKISR